jgi:uncharacterized protein (DUF1810 family)
MSIDRFKTAQADPRSGYKTALQELRAGQKVSHWIWYVFPQLASLGRSSTAQLYGIGGLAEAQAYLLDPVLRQRLVEITAVVDRQLAVGVPLEQLLGGRTDSQKLVSSLTLFQSAADSFASEHPGLELPEFSHRCDHILMMAEEQGYPPCAQTRAELAGT